MAETKEEKKARLAAEAEAKAKIDGGNGDVPEDGDDDADKSAPKEEKLPEGEKITVLHPNGTQRVYTEATHGPHYRTLALAYKKGQNGKFAK